jgi:hypothetical protein
MTKKREAVDGRSASLLPSIVVPAETGKGNFPWYAEMHDRLWDAFRDRGQGSTAAAAEKWSPAVKKCLAPGPKKLKKVRRTAWVSIEGGVVRQQVSALADFRFPRSESEWERLRAAIGVAVTEAASAEELFSRLKAEAGRWDEAMKDGSHPPSWSSSSGAQGLARASDGVSGGVMGADRDVMAMGAPPAHTPVQHTPEPTTHGSSGSLQQPSYNNISPINFNNGGWGSSDHEVSPATATAAAVSLGVNLEVLSDDEEVGSAAQPRGAAPPLQHAHVGGGPGLGEGAAGGMENGLGGHPAATSEAGNDPIPQLAALPVGAGNAAAGFAKLIIANGRADLRDLAPVAAARESMKATHLMWEADETVLQEVEADPGLSDLFNTVRVAGSVTLSTYPAVALMARQVLKDINIDPAGDLYVCDEGWVPDV